MYILNYYFLYTVMDKYTCKKSNCRIKTLDNPKSFTQKKMSKSNKAIASQKKQKDIVKSESESDDDFGTNYSTGSYASNAEEDVEEENTQSTYMETKQYSEEVLSAEAGIPYYEVEFIGQAKIPVSEFVKSGKNGPDLNGDCNIVFNLDNGRLKLGRRTNLADFAPLSCGGGDDKKKKKNKGEAESGNLDIVKSIRFEDFKFNYDREFVISMDSVPKFNSEGFYGESTCVNHVVMPGALSKKNSGTLEILNRPISNRVILFQNQYPGVSLDTFAKDIQPAREGLSLVHFGSPLIGMINEHKAADTKNGVYNAPSQGLERTKQVLVPNKLIKVYKPKTMELMKNSISYANVTNGFKITFTAPIPDHRLAAHREWVRTSRQSGKPFFGFGDPYHRNNASLASTFDNKSAMNLDSVEDLDIAFKCIVQYRHINDEPIQLKI